MRALGLDVGTRTVGVAMSDPLGVTAQGLTTLRRRGIRADLSALGELARTHGVTHAVVGLPLNMDGSEGASAARSRAFGEALARSLGVPVDYWDERLTTVAAERALREGDVSGRRRRELVDQVAAALILQGWLDARGRPQEGEA
ncbi:MAG TPA: Holliday junction resolvase RuvX [Candidatus Methylomirabilis sp.]|nr:Holliday junction resolvase RuvX [Candidatus Methylomirabilis sp.]